MLVESDGLAVTGRMEGQGEGVGVSGCRLGGWASYVSETDQEYRCGRNRYRSVLLKFDFMLRCGCLLTRVHAAWTLVEARTMYEEAVLQ